MFTVTKIEIDKPGLYWVYLQADYGDHLSPSKINLRIPLEKRCPDINDIVKTANAHALSLLRSIVDSISSPVAGQEERS
jgi:hypothetical protein